MDRLETRELVYFLAVAQDLHFGRAAERLGIAQPPLSRAIGRLERRLGVRLFERTSRRVALTPAGEVFLAEAEEALSAIDRVAHRTRQAGGSAPLKIATNPGTGSGLLTKLVDVYSHLPVEIVFTNQQSDAVRTGAADVGLVCSTDDLTGLATMALAVEKPLALLARSDRSAAAAGISVSDVQRRSTFARCPSRSLNEVLDLVAVGQLVVVVGDGVVDRVGDSVAAVPVIDLPATTLLLVWRAGTPTPAVQAFIASARALAAIAPPAELSVATI